MHQQPAHRLVLQDRGRARIERPLDHLRARQGAGRLFLDQRHALPARPGARLRRVGADHRRLALELGQRAAHLQAERGLLGRRRRDARRQGRVARREAAPALGHPRPLHAGRTGGRHPLQAGLQPRRQFRHRPLRGEPEEGRALECLEGHAAPGAAPAQPEGGDRRADRQSDHGRQGSARRRVQPRRCRTPRHGAHRDPAHGRRHRLADHPAAFRHRPGQGAAESRRAAGA